MENLMTGLEIYKVIRKQDIVIVAILKNKSDGTYSFVNLTKGHICQCKFKSKEEAIEDLKQYKNKNKIIDYKIMRD